MAVKYAPQVQSYIRRLSYNSCIQEENYSYDEISLKNIDTIFRLLRQVKQTNEDMWELWLTAERGPIEAFGDYEKLLLNGEVENKGDFEARWKDECPDEISWYDFSAVESKDTGCKGIFLANKMLIRIDPRKSDGYKQDLSEFTEWLLHQVEKCIDELRNGTYNKRVKDELPFKYRTGTIVRKDLHDFCPYLRNYFKENLTEQQLSEFVNLIKQQPDDIEKTETIPHLTAGGFYKLCSLGYKANNYSDCDKSPKEQYYLHADGRDDGLKDIDPNSEKEFINWLHYNTPFGGHPWEVCRGGPTTHISLLVHRNENGFRLSLDGNAPNRCIETIKFYLALRNYGVPVYLRYGKELKERVLETELIGIVPETVFPVYCESMFHGMKIIDFMHLPSENREQIAEKCRWLPEKEILLS